MAKLPNIAKNFNCLSMAHERYRQTTERRTGDDIAKMNVNARSLKWRWSAYYDHCDLPWWYTMPCKLVEF